MNCKGLQATWEILGFSTIGFLGAFSLLKCVGKLQEGNVVTSGVCMSSATEPFPTRLSHTAGVPKHTLRKMLNHTSPQTPRINEPRGPPLRVEKRLNWPWHLPHLEDPIAQEFLEAMLDFPG